MNADRGELAGTFKERARKALGDAHLRVALDRTTGNARTKRAAAVAAWPDFDRARAAAAAIKDHALQNFPYYLEQFERNALASGARLHWARDAKEACAAVIKICRETRAKTVTRSKSMLGEEIGLPHALAEAGVRRVETDLAEHIIQLAGETPSHIIWPAAHRTREDVSKLFEKHHRDHLLLTEVEAMVDSARRELRDDFFSADVGISGANFLVAETGAICTITNEGNAELTTTPPRVHIVTAGIEKIVATTEHALQLTRVLVRSATGADLTQYTTFHCGPKRAGDLDGPEEFHIVLVDHGRTQMLEDMPEMLRCLRCGACLNHCVVYRKIGGHAYGGAYPGPMGSAITPVFDGLEPSRDLPHACTLNGHCKQVCPVDIPLPTILRDWRAKSYRQGFESRAVRLGLALWAFIASKPALYRAALAVALPLLRRRGKDGWISALPFAPGWTESRDFPAPPEKTFLARIASGEEA
ncbi:(Fe-S)-binding protein [Rhodoblastus sphagnicola]|uniref:(Fe-S)-binding protein n=1 Tax=Rhodoblastus sphagnicola TaxID=333368 RepID=A0A2S6N7I6_9HYPH|nr:lactate utilization protein B [Rhodoblastus sphagnicola]MBB4196233.1 L-lactate dehydrogenase complex protein LldF [Rhodoblastus sphagnicola]PPQ30557.1 (Fe-S)-binding protein [Rhodoblastus sphagnicola]